MIRQRLDSLGKKLFGAVSLPRPLHSKSSRGMGVAVRIEADQPERKQTSRGSEQPAGLLTTQKPGPCKIKASRHSMVTVEGSWGHGWRQLALEELPRCVSRCVVTWNVTHPAT